MCAFLCRLLFSTFSRTNIWFLPFSHWPHPLKKPIATRPPCFHFFFFSSSFLFLFLFLLVSRETHLHTRSRRRAAADHLHFRHPFIIPLSFSFCIFFIFIFNSFSLSQPLPNHFPSQFYLKKKKKVFTWDLQFY